MVKKRLQILYQELIVIKKCFLPDVYWYQSISCDICLVKTDISQLLTKGIKVLRNKLLYITLTYFYNASLHHCRKPDIQHK